MPSNCGINSNEILKYADILRKENAQLKEELAHLRKELKNHIGLCERRFQEIYPCLSLYEKNSETSHVAPFIEQTKQFSLASSIYK